MKTATRRTFLPAGGSMALGAALAANVSAQSTDFDIDKSFAQFMRDISGSPDDCGGTVIFTSKANLSKTPSRGKDAHPRGSNRPVWEG